MIIDTTKTYDCPHKLNWRGNVVKVNSGFCRSCDYRNGYQINQSSFDCIYSDIWEKFLELENEG